RQLQKSYRAAGRPGGHHGRIGDRDAFRVRGRGAEAFGRKHRHGDGRRDHSMSDPRVWIASPEYAGGDPQFLVVKPGYTVVGTIPIEGVAFSLDWAAASVLYLAGMTTPAAMSGDV